MDLKRKYSNKLLVMIYFQQNVNNFQSLKWAHDDSDKDSARFVNHAVTLESLALMQPCPFTYVTRKKK